MIKYVPDGYYQDGKSRPWKEVEILEITGNMATIKYLDSGNIMPCPVAALKENKNG